METRTALVNAGDFVLDLLARHTDYTDDQATVSAIDVAARIGGDEAVRFLTRFNSDSRPLVIHELVRASFVFDPDEFAIEVLRDLPAESVLTSVPEGEGLAHLRHMRKLRQLKVERPTDENLGDLRSLSSLTHLAIYGFNRIEELSGLSGLRSLELHDVTDHGDLTCLRFLEAPESLRLFGWPELRDVSYLGR